VRVRQRKLTGKALVAEVKAIADVPFSASALTHIRKQRSLPQDPQTRVALKKWVASHNSPPTPEESINASTLGESCPVHVVCSLTCVLILFSVLRSDGYFA